MTVDGRTPVLVGVGAVEQREADPARAREPVELMVGALERAAEDAGAPSLLARAEVILIPRGFWDYPDPGRIVAERIGATDVRTLVAEIGVLQTTLLAEAATAIARGECDVALVVGGEAKYRSLRAKIQGVAAPLTAQAAVEPDRILRPVGEMMSRLEVERGLVMPVQQYAIIENALRFAQGLSLDAHRRQVAELWAGFSRVAVDNPHAWTRDVVDADTIREAGSGNAMLAFPYTKLHNSQWNVDQAAGLILCSLEAARAAGVSEDRMVFPHAVAESNHMQPLSERRVLPESPGFRHAGRRALEHVGIGIDQVEHLELYSCFPSAVRLQARELGVDPARSPTVTGGMTFAGGPLNNFVLQAWARMAEVLRESPGSFGMVNAVSGLMTKQGVTLWSTRPPERGFVAIDVSDEVRRDTEIIEVVADVKGGATVAGYTVRYDGDTPSQAVVYCDLEDGRRALVVSPDPALAAAMTNEEFCGRSVRLAADGSLYATD
jgi:acetyl-CoA C-acetyltransferase